jgi:hypothetical protein
VTAFLDVVPTWLTALLVVGGAVALSVGLLVLVRRSVAPESLRGHHEVAGALINVIGVLFAVLLAFVVLAVWEQHSRTEEHVEQEADAVSDLLRLGDGFDADAPTRVAASVRNYARIVVEDEWPAMARGESSQSADAAIDELYGTLHAIEPQSMRESGIYNEAVSQLDKITDARTQRILRAGAGLPGVFWGLVVGGATVVISYSMMFAVERFWSHALLTAGLTGTVAFVIVVILSLEFPFSGDLAIAPDALEGVLSAGAE